MEDIGKVFFFVVVVAAGCIAFFHFKATPHASSDTEYIEYALYNDINTMRKSSGLKPLEMDEGLTELAKIRAIEASKNWSHKRPNGQDGTSLIPGTSWKGENLSFVEHARDADTAVDVQFSDLCASTAHLGNMLLDVYTKVGIASYVDADGKITTAYLFMA